jgi:predicted nucleic acid-binding protein
MTSSIDSNVFVALWDVRSEVHLPARHGLDRAQKAGSLVIPGCVYAELLAGPGRSVAVLDDFFADTDIAIEWQMSERIWKKAGEAFHAYAARRRRSHSPASRRILAEFLIGAHAESNGYSLLTQDQRLYKAAFPGLRVVGV